MGDTGMKPFLSICMMVKNEEKNMERCLKSLQYLMKGIPSELIIVDTGSTDRTVEIARQFTSKIYFHIWNNNFSEMRNTSISYAVGQWILIIDADEELETSDALVNFIKGRTNRSIGCATVLVKSITDDMNGYYATVVSPRLFRNDKHFCYHGVVHNVPCYRGKVIHLNSSIMHYGYVTSDNELMERKFQRTSTLLLQELDKNPDDIYYRYQLSVSYSMHGEWTVALQELEKIYQRYKDENDDFWHKNLYVIGGLLQACAANDCLNDEYIQFGLRGISLEPEYVDLYFYLAQLYETQGNFSEAYEFYARHEKLVNDFSQLSFSHNMALQHHTLSFLTIDYYNMGVISLRNEDYIRARRHLLRMLETAATNDPYINKARMYIINLDFQEKSFSDSLRIYKMLMESKLDDELLSLELEIEKAWRNLQEKERDSFCRQFKDLPNIYGKLNLVRSDIKHMGDTEWESVIRIINRTDMNILPDYYAPLFEYCLKFWPQEAGQISAYLSEQTIVRYMSYLDELYKERFVRVCREYVNLIGDDDSKDYQIVRLRKNVTKYLLFSGQLNENEYLEVFKLYIRSGQSYMGFLYKELVFENELIYDLKNKEEIFLLYITLANRNANQRSYISYLKKSLKAFPEMYKGIDRLLQCLPNQNVNEEMEKLMNQLLASLEGMMETEQYDAALSFIEECKNIVGDDIRLLAIKSRILLNYQ